MLKKFLCILGVIACCVSTYFFGYWNGSTAGTDYRELVTTVEQLRADELKLKKELNTQSEYRKKLDEITKKIIKNKSGLDLIYSTFGESFDELQKIREEDTKIIIDQGNEIPKIREELQKLKKKSVK